MRASGKTVIIVLTALVLLSALFRYFFFAGGQMYIDELTYARLGYSLWHGYLASDSSLLQVYQEFNATTNNIITPYGSIDSVEPWLDHPPLVGFLLVPVLAVGALPRTLPIILESLVALSLYFAVRSIDRYIAILASILFLIFVQLYQLLSMLFLDVAVSFFFITTIGLTVAYRRNGSTRYLYLAGITAGLTFLSKESGMASIIYLVLFAFYEYLNEHHRNTRKLLATVLISLILTSIWPLYGIATDAGLFRAVISADASRSILSGHSPLGVATVFVSSFNYTPSQIIISGLDPLLIFSWIAIVYLLFKKEFRLYQLGLISYVVTIILLRFAWAYTMIPLFPFYSIAIAILVRDISVYFYHFWLARRITPLSSLIAK